jgi:hypothetical protein
MVKVRPPHSGNKKNPFFSIQKHIVVLIFVTAVILCGTLLVVFQRQELSSHRLRFQHNNNGMMMAHAHSAKHMLNKPHLVYGTAWKKEETARYVSEAVKAGFRFIDTAAQPKHYNEAGVGNGWTAAAQELGLTRSDIWLQTKYSPSRGQDLNDIPYDPKAPLDEQVRTSLNVSLKNLHTDYLDSWVLHSPLETFEETMKVWRTMEEAVDDGKVLQVRSDIGKSASCVFSSSHGPL